MNSKKKLEILCSGLKSPTELAKQTKNATQNIRPDCGILNDDEIILNCSRRAQKDNEARKGE